MGYKNGLGLNSDLAEKDDWTIDDITERADILADRIVKRFAYDGEN